jgi:hypothetical protein
MSVTTSETRRKNGAGHQSIQKGQKSPAMPRTSVSPEQEYLWAGRVPHITQGRYPDGLPYHDIEYICCKLILKPNRFNSRKSLFDFGKVLRRPAAEHGVDFSTQDYIDQPIKIREVLFVDTVDFRLYNNAFILRRRIPYVDGFPQGDPEIVFKFRHSDIQVAAETDVRPQIRGEHRVKFKCQALPLKDQLGGIRMLFSHNVQFPRSYAGNGDVFSMDVLTSIFPVLEKVRKEPGERISLVSNTYVEEVLQDIGELDFGDGVMAKVNIAIWRTRGEHLPLIGEFAFQVRFRDRKQLSLDAMQRMERFFLALQYEARDAIALNATKTGIVYRLLGNPPKAHE